MNIKKAEKKLKEADSFLTTLGKILKKHWKLLLFIFACYVVYEIWSTPLDDEYSEDYYYEDTLDY